MSNMSPMHTHAHFVIEKMPDTQQYIQLVFVNGPLDAELTREILCWIDSSDTGKNNLKFVGAGLARFHNRRLLSVPDWDYKSNGFQEGTRDMYEDSIRDHVPAGAWTMFTDEM